MTFIPIIDIFDQLHEVNVDFIVEVIAKGENTVIITTKSTITTKKSMLTILDTIETLTSEKE